MKKMTDQNIRLSSTEYGLHTLVTEASQMCVDAKYRSTSGRPSLAKSSAVERLLIHDDAFEQIGPARARMLVSHFGDSLHEAILNDDPHLYEILPIKAAQILVTAYKTEGRAEAVELALWLDRHGAPAWLGHKAAKYWGHRDAAAIRNNPYILGELFDWDLADRIAQREGIGPNDPRRLISLVEREIARSRLKGNTAIHSRDLYQKLRREGLHDDLVRLALDTGYTDFALVQVNDLVQNPGCALMEALLARRAVAGSYGRSDAAQSDFVIEADIAAQEIDQGYALTPNQKTAVIGALRSDFYILSGYAGTGKTSVLNTVCQLAIKYGMKPMLMALSGRAAVRVTEATKLEATTCTTARNFLARGTIKDENLFIIIDEASMCDLTIIHDILHRAPKAKVLLAGDNAQLPPIGLGKPFHELVASPYVTKTVLSEVMRQKAATGIPKFAEKLRHGHAPCPETFIGQKQGVFHVECTEGAIFPRLVQIGQTLRSLGFDRDDMQIVTGPKQGEAGVWAINKHFSEMKKDRPHFPGRETIRQGDPILFKKNDYERGLRNGSLGRLMNVDDNGALAVLDNTEIKLGLDDAEKIQLAYAITGHKAQGSQWRAVVLPIFDSMSTWLIDRSWIYTSATRATDLLIFIGEWASVAKRVSAPPRSAATLTALPQHLELFASGLK